MIAEASSLNEDTPVVWAETAISTDVDGELVALDVTKGVCYGLNRIGTRIWQLVETPRSARQVSEILLSEFEVRPEVCLDETLGLLRELKAAGLVL